LVLKLTDHRVPPPPTRESTFFRGVWGGRRTAAHACGRGTGKGSLRAQIYRFGVAFQKRSEIEERHTHKAVVCWTVCKPESLNQRIWCCAWRCDSPPSITRCGGRFTCFWYYREFGEAPPSGCEALAHNQAGRAATIISLTRRVAPHLSLAILQLPACREVVVSWRRNGDIALAFMAFNSFVQMDHGRLKSVSAPLDQPDPSGCSAPRELVSWCKVAFGSLSVAKFIGQGSCGSNRTEMPSPVRNYPPLPA